MSKLTTILCQLSDIPNGDSKELYSNGEALFAIRQDGDVFVYRNNCPHTGMPLNWQPDQFLDVDKKFIQCAVHAAIFQPNTGLCVAGPCNGESLSAVANKVRDGIVYIELETLSK